MDLPANDDCDWGTTPFYPIALGTKFPLFGCLLCLTDEGMTVSFLLVGMAPVAVLVSKPSGTHTPIHIGISVQ